MPLIPLNVGLVNSVFASSLSPLLIKTSPTTIKFLAAKVSLTDTEPPITAGPSTCKFPLKAASLA